MKILRFSLIFFLFFIYCYSIVFTIFPVSTKILLGGVGLIYVFLKLTIGRYRLKKEFVWIIKYSVFLCLWDILLSIITGYYQFHYCRIMVTPISGVLGACILYECSKKYIKTENDFHLFFVFVVFTECLLTVLMKVHPSLYSIVMSIQQSDTGNKEISDITDYYRMIGIGNAVFFGVLPVCSFSLLSCTYLLSNKIKGIFVNFFLIFAFLTISMTYFFCARTALAIVAIAFVQLLIIINKVSLKQLLFILISIIVVVLLGINFLENNLNDSMFQWAFGFLVDNDMESDNSVATVMEWWKNAKFDIGTFAFGDGCYVNPDGTYYQKVDIGWFRNIYYSGIIGLFLILFYHFKLLVYIYKCHRGKNMKLMLFLLFMSYCVILAKGDAIMLTFLILYLVYYKGGIFESKKKNIIINNNEITSNIYGL